MKPDFEWYRQFATEGLRSSRGALILPREQLSNCTEIIAGKITEFEDILRFGGIITRTGVRVTDITPEERDIIFNECISKLREPDGNLRFYLPSPSGKLSKVVRTVLAVGSLYIDKRHIRYIAEDSFQLVPILPRIPNGKFHIVTPNVISRINQGKGTPDEMFITPITVGFPYYVDGEISVNDFPTIYIAAYEGLKATLKSEGIPTVFEGKPILSNDIFSNAFKFLVQQNKSE